MKEDCKKSVKNRYKPNIKKVSFDVEQGQKGLQAINVVVL